MGDATNKKQGGKVKNVGTVYLICFDRPYQARTGACKKQARHYIGWALDVDARLAEHRAGQGARLLQVANGDGITYSVVRTWPGDRRLERRLKNWHKAGRLCPCCRAAEQAARSRAAALAALQPSLAY